MQTHTACNTRKLGLSDVCVTAQINLKRHCPFYVFFCLQQVFFSKKSNGVVKCRLGSAQADPKRHFTQMSERPILACCKPIMECKLRAVRRRSVLSVKHLLYLFPKPSGFELISIKVCFYYFERV